MLQYLEKIKAIAIDVDGVMTNGDILLTDDGQFLRTFNIRDGYAIRKAIDEGLKIVVISGGKSLGVKKRLEDLGVIDVFLGVNDKFPSLLNWLNKNNLGVEELAYMGDDILDIKAMSSAALKACPADAVPEIKEIANYISPFSGGKGCVRDLIEIILKAQDRW